MSNTDATTQKRPPLPRGSLATLRACLDRQPAVVIEGARGVGKTTLAQQVAPTTFDLSNARDRATLSTSAETTLSAAVKPVLIDEWQLLPDIAWTVKHLIDQRGQRGFVLAGSVPPDVDAFEQFPLTARCAVMEVTPLSVSERRSQPNLLLLDQLFMSATPTNVEQLDTAAYYSMLFESGYPGVLDLDDQQQRTALNGLARTVVNQDVPTVHPELRGEVSKRNLRRFLRTCAALSGTSTTLKTLADLSRVGEKTARRYRDALVASRLLALVEVWRPQAAAAPKVEAKQLLLDAGLMPVLVRRPANAILRDPDLLGRLVETFVHAQLTAIASWETHECEIMTYEYPDPKRRNGPTTGPQFPHGGIDFLLESVETSKMVAIGVKARDHFQKRDVARMIALRKALDADDDGERRFAAGLALCCADMPVLEVDDRIWAAPLSILWAQG